MKKILLNYLSFLLILFVGLIFVIRAHAAINYSNSNGNFTISFDNNVEDFGDCANTTFWRINLSYDSGTEVQGSVRSTDSLSGTDSFSISDGTAIQSIELWAGYSEEEATTGACRYGIADNAEGIFTWDAGATISDILVSNVTSSSVTVSWTTNEAADSTVYYGTTTSYGSTATDSTSTTSHSVSLTGLSASTTYHYKVKSSSTESGDNTFATPASGSTGSNQSGTSTTVTVTGTPTPTPLPDVTPPSISLTTNLEKAFLTSPKIAGKASDASGIVNVEYSLDDGRNWNAVDAIPNLGAKSVNFTFTPPPLDDDNYNLRIRATDNADARNVGVSEAYTLIIDRLPPAVGGNIISIGPQILFPNAAGYLLTTTGIRQKITLSAVGGPTKITLSAYPPEASASAQTYELNRNPDNGLWSGTISFAEPGIYQLKAISLDGAGNTTTRLINSIAAIPPGKVVDTENKNIKDATVKLYYFEEKYRIWRVWDGPSYDQKNPINTNAQGEFSYLLPSGRYYFDISANGFSHTISEIFTVEEATLITPTFTLKPLKVLLDFGFFKLYLPDFSTDTLPITMKIPSLPTTKHALIEKEAPRISLPTTDETRFDLYSYRGTPLVVSFINLWTPQTTEQIAALDQLQTNNLKAFAVIVGNPLDKTTLFKKNGNYTTPIAVDPDGSLIEKYNITTLPTHYFIDRRGVIKQVITGVLNEEELETKLLEIQ